MVLKISDECIGCGTCVESCPTDAIVESGDVYIITDECDECSACVDVCPVNAIIN
jgi:electron transfer flavoprotein alpha subunit